MNVNSQGLRGFIGKNRVVLASVLSATVSAGSTYIVSKKILSRRYEELAAAEIEQAKQYYKVINKDGEFSSPSAMVDALDIDVVSDISVAMGYVEPKHTFDYVDPAPIDESRVIRGPITLQEVSIGPDSLYPIEAVDPSEGTDETTAEEDDSDSSDTRNIFQDAKSANSVFDYDEELKHRTTDRPYIITYDEYYQNEDDYEQDTITYYEEDDVAVDARDEPIPDQDDIFGDDNLLRFGHGSKDNNIVYIRNDKLQTLFEVVRSNGSYAQQVLGVMKHSDSRKVRRFRRGDDE